MKKGNIMILKTLLIVIISTILTVCCVLAQNDKIIKLLPPQTEIGKPLMQALKLRHSDREFNIKSLPLQELSNLIWAADGINRIETEKRTAPTAMNKQEVDVYLAMQDGLYIYLPKEHSLKLVLKEDIRSLAGKQDFVKDAPLNLIYVADFSKMGEGKIEDKIVYSAADVGFIAQNVYLYCASQGLNVVIRAFIDKEVLSQKMNLKPEQKIILSQTVGYPK